MSGSDAFRFVNLLALELENGDITLPSLPDVVLKIRGMLEKEDCDFERIGKAVSVDPVLVSRLMLFANSAYHNRANVKIESLNTAIGRLGFEVVRSTAVSLAINQIYVSEKHSRAAKHLKAVWARSMKLSSMAYAVAQAHSALNEESAFMCGLLHEVGKLYIITKAEGFPDFLGDPDTFQGVLEEWNPQVSKSIIEAWGFSYDMVESTDPESYVDSDESLQPKLADAIYIAKLLLDNSEEETLSLFDSPSCKKLGIDEASIKHVMDNYRGKLSTMQQSLV